MRFWCAGHLLTRAVSCQANGPGLRSNPRRQHTLVRLHHRACVAARPDPETLAARLFEWGLHSEWETFYGAATTFADVLGEGGLAVVRKLAEEV